MPSLTQRRATSDKRGAGLIAHRSLLIAHVAFQFISTAVATGQAPATGPTTKPASLSEDGLVIATVNGTLAERVWSATGGRTDKPTYQERQRYEVERSVDLLRAMRQLRINMLVFPYGGYGPPSYENEELMQARSFAERARQEGFLTGLWMPLGLVHSATWSAASQPFDGLTTPPVDDWLLRNSDGKPLMASVPAWSYATHASRGYQQHADRLIDEGIRTVRPDAVILPYFSMSAGYEPAGREAFRAHIAERLGRPGVAGRLGISDASGVAPPDPMASVGALTEEWLRFRAGLMSARLQRIRERVAPSTKLGIEIPIGSVPPALTVGPVVGLADLTRHADLVWCAAPIRTDANGRAQLSIGAIKAVSDQGCRPVLTCISPLEVAQAMAFGRDAGVSIAYFHDGQISADSTGRRPLVQQTVSLASFLCRRREYFRGVRRISDVVLPRCSDLAVDGSPNDRASYIQTENALVTHGIPFTVSLDASLASVQPDQVIVLAGMSYIDDMQIDRIERHVRGGGGLVMIGAVGTHDELGAPRTVALRQRLIEQAAPASAPAGLSGGVAAATWTLGRGRIVALARPGPPTNFWMMIRKDVKRPAMQTARHKDEFASAVRWAAGGRLHVEMPLGETGVIELTQSGDKRLLMLHHLNYHPTRPEVETRASVVVPRDRRVVRLRHLTPATDAESAVPFEIQGDVVTFRVGACLLYELYVIESEPVS